MKDNSASGPIYGIAVIGAAVYYVQHATTFLAAMVGLFKAVFWPALIMYRVLELLKM